MLGGHKSVENLDLDQNRSSKRSAIKHATSKRLSGRPSICPSPSVGSTNALHSESDVGEEKASHRSHHHLEHLVDQVSEWIREERVKRHERKDGQHVSSSQGATNGHAEKPYKAESGASHDFSLDRLEEIIKHNLRFGRRSKRDPTFARSRGSIRKLLRHGSVSSDTDYADSEALVPTCDVVLDNSKTLAYAGGASEDSDSSSDELQRTASYKDRDAWTKFKFEIVRLTHTLRLKGWRRVPMRMCSHLTIERLSGALTNAVYVVSPPENLPDREQRGKHDGDAQARKPPPKLLLRIYGPQVEHLIDRDAELAILRRLCQKNIGPRLLGTFANGRFEEYLHAKPLTLQDFHNPDTSRQIAKRMRELHDGIELLEAEREAGAFVWRNWDSWVPRVEQVVTWLDVQVSRLEPGSKPSGSEAWKRRGLILGVRWKQFRQMVEKYRAWLYEQYGGREIVREQLVFAHNDAQYGNILRLMPTGESPLLLPANTHKQLIVIDFEYANANVPGLEFANHFTEWCYNYHDERKPYAFHPEWYPTPEEQDRFIRAYVRHRPQYNATTPKMVPETPSGYTSSGSDVGGSGLLRRPTSSISDFMLDARTPSTAHATEDKDEAIRKKNEDEEITRLMHETRLWRLANTAMWVAWGLVQAKIPGMPKFSPESSPERRRSSDDELMRAELGETADEYGELSAEQGQGEESANGSEQEEAEEEFDYLGYAQHRAMFFWADAIQLGLAETEDLPQDLVEKVKKVPY